MARRAPEWAVPLYVYVREVRKTLGRFGLFDAPEAVTDPYLDRAREMFESDPDVAAFVFGHTHRVSFRSLQGRAVINTGTWRKRFARTPPRIGVLPPVFHPSNFKVICFRSQSIGRVVRGAISNRSAPGACRRRELFRARIEWGE
jgi:hypothetical protein